MKVPMEKSGQGAEVEELGLVSPKVVLSPGSHCSDLGGGMSILHGYSEAEHWKTCVERGHVLFARSS